MDKVLYDIVLNVFISSTVGIILKVNGGFHLSLNKDILPIAQLKKFKFASYDPTINYLHNNYCCQFYYE